MFQHKNSNVNRYFPRLRGILSSVINKKNNKMICYDSVQSGKKKI